jgi:hypothetical protein
MKHSVIMRERRGAVGIDEAETIIGGRQMLELARKAGWLTPKIQGNRLTLFDYDETLACWKRICLEGFDSLKTSSSEARKKNEEH